MIDLNFIEQIPCVDILAFPKLTESQFFSEYALKMELPIAKKFINYYNKIRSIRTGYLGILPAEYSHEFNKISPDWQRKIITIGIDDDLVIMALKRVQMFKYIYTRMDGLPISINGNRENETKVLIEIAKYKLCHKISVNSKEQKILKKLKFPFSNFVETYNFYSHIPTNFKKIDKNKWRTKKGINRMLKMKNLTWEELTGPSDAINIISEGFDRWKIKTEGVVFGKKLSRGIKKYKFWEDPNVLYYLFSYKDIPVGLCVYIISDGIANQIINKTIGHLIYEQDFNKLNKEEELELDELKRRVNAFIHYTTIKDLKERGIQHSYFGGVFRAPSLRVFKRIMNDKEIEHYVYRLHNFSK